MKRQFKAKREEITLQEAWDVIADHLDICGGGGNAHCFFIDSNEVMDHIAIHSIAPKRIIVSSTKKYK
jgi:hypothetical protein